MDKSKAKKAVKKSESRKKEAKAAEALLGMQAMAASGLDPEIQASRSDLQPPTVNPYHAMGTMAPTMYSAGNMLPGYNTPMMLNPEA